MRFFVFPLDDYPDIFYVYKQMIKNGNFFSIARFINLNDLFEKYSCYLVKPESTFLDYLLGGGIYQCSKFPLSFTYFYYFLIISIIFAAFVLYFYQLSLSLPNEKNRIFKKIILNLILLPSTTFFLLSFHIDIPYHFLTIALILGTVYMAFVKKLKWILPIFLFPFLVINYLSPDNQSIIFVGLLISAVFSHFLSKREVVINLFDNLSEQFSRILSYNFSFSKKVLINVFLFFFTILFLIIFYKFQLLSLLADPRYMKVGEISKIASVYVNSENVELFGLLSKYPIYFRLFGVFQGLIISTPFGIKPSLLTTTFFFISFFVGFLRTFSFKNMLFPVFIKIFIVLSFILMILVLSIFPFFSYTKYWVYWIPFVAIFMTFVPRLSLISLVLIYSELFLKSDFISF